MILMHCGNLTAYPRPPQVNGAEHYDVATLDGTLVGRLTRRTKDRPTPGWYVWVGWPAGHQRILRDDDEVVYHGNPADALYHLWMVLSSASSFDTTPFSAPVPPSPYPFELGQVVEVLGHDGKPKYRGMFTGEGETQGSYSVYTRDTLEFHNVPKDFVRHPEGEA